MIEALMRPDDEIPSESSDDDPDFSDRQGSVATCTRGRTGRRGELSKYPARIIVSSTKQVEHNFVYDQPQYKIADRRLPI